MKSIDGNIVRAAGRGSILSLLKPSIEQLGYTSSCELSEDKSMIFIKAPIMTAIEIIVNARKAFVYSGVSYDYILLEPCYQDHKNISYVKTAKVTIATCQDAYLNKLEFHIKRK